MFFKELIDKNYQVVDNFFSNELVAKLKEKYNGENFINAGTGRNFKYQQGSLRGDKIKWLNENEEVDDEVCKQFNQVRLQLNEECLIGLNCFEAHLAFYNIGQGYTKHIDAFNDGKNRRKISMVVYLNDEWSEKDGGQLRIYNENNEIIEDVLPVKGRAVFFISEKVPHEVIPCNKKRWSIACWFKD